MYLTMDINASERAAVIAKLRDLSRRARDWRPAHKAASGALRKSIATIFIHEGPGWSPLRTLTAEKRRYGWGYYRRHGFEGAEHRILHWTHSLLKSMTEEKHRLHIEASRPTRRDFVFGSKHRAAYYHQYGAARIGMPRRAILPPLSQVRQTFVTAMRDYMEEGIRA